MEDRAAHVAAGSRAGSSLRVAASSLARLFRVKMPMLDTVTRRQLKAKRNAAGRDKDYCAAAECSISLGTPRAKAWKKAGDRYARCGKAEDAAACYLKAGREDMLGRKAKDARKEENYMAAAAFEIALGVDRKEAWERAGDAYVAKNRHSMAAVCYRKGGLDAKAESAEAKSGGSTVSPTDFGYPGQDLSGDNYRFDMNPGSVRR